MTLSIESARTSRLLAALPCEFLTELLPHLKETAFELKAVLHEPGLPITTVYFPAGGFVSVLAALEDGDAVEVAVIGSEGMVGIAVLLGAEHDNLETMVQNPMSALAIDAGTFRELVGRLAPLRDHLLRFVLVYQEQMARTAACNGHHHVLQRLARWLLMAHDRVGIDLFPMTHETLAMMLGVRRAGVTVAAASLQRAGFIEYRRGMMEITDRPGLESASCECYEMVRRRVDQYLPPTGAALSRPT